MQLVVQHTRLLYGLGWCIGWLQFIKAVRRLAGNVCQEKKCTQCIQCTQFIQWHSNLETGKADMKNNEKWTVGKYDSFYCFFLWVGLKVPAWFFFWLQDLDDTLISSSPAFHFSSLNVRLLAMLAINMNVSLNPDLL